MKMEKVPLARNIANNFLKNKKIMQILSQTSKAKFG